MSQRRRRDIREDSRKILEATGLTKIYGAGPISTVALRDVSFEIKRGEFVLIVGESGSGKSTLLHMIGLLDKPTAGRIIIDGIDTSGLSDAERSEVRKHKIGFIFQAFNLLADLTVIENVMLPGMMVGNDPLDAIQREAETILEKVGLARQIHKQPNQLSIGQIQRVAIARALINRPTLVLADEPTGNLDSRSAQAVIALMKQLNKELNRTFVIVTHSKESFGAVDKTIVLKDGKIEGIEQKRLP